MEQSCATCKHYIISGGKVKGCEVTGYYQSPNDSCDSWEVHSNLTHVVELEEKTKVIKWLMTEEGKRW
jgi:hypothetical protein